MDESRRTRVEAEAGTRVNRGTRPALARPSRLRSRLPALFGLLVFLLGPPGALAEPGGSAPGADAAPAPNEGRDEALSVPGRATGSTPGARVGSGDPGLDALLRLPSDFETQRTSAPVAGASEDEWRRRFDRAEKAIGEAREALTRTREELDGLAESGGGSQWSVAPPGATGGDQTTSPLSFKLRQEIQRNRESLDEAEKALRELRIEADLAGVPPEWRVVAAGDAQPETTRAPVEN